MSSASTIAALEKMYKRQYTNTLNDIVEMRMKSWANLYVHRPTVAPAKEPLKEPEFNEYGEVCP